MPERKIRLAVLFGGRSGEHDVSCRSAASILARVINEVNTFPGFTSASQYPRMWQAAGLAYPDLLDVLIGTARAGR